MARLEKHLIWPCDWQEVYEEVVNRPTQDLDRVRAMAFVKDATVLRNEWLDDKHHVVFEIESNARLPGPIMALVPGGKLSWKQVGVWCPQERVLAIDIDPQVQNRTVIVQSRFALHEHDQGTRMHALLEVKAKIPFLSGLIEKLVITRVDQSVIGHYENMIKNMNA